MSITTRMGRMGFVTIVTESNAKDLAQQETNVQFLHQKRKGKVRLEKQ